MKKNKELEKKWRNILGNFKIENLNKTMFCKKYNLKMNQFIYWNNKLATEIYNSAEVISNIVDDGVIQSPMKSFIKVNTVDNVVKFESISVLINGVKIIIPEEFNTSTLARLINVVKACD